MAREVVNKEAIKVLWDKRSDTLYSRSNIYSSKTDFNRYIAERIAIDPTLKYFEGMNKICQGDFLERTLSILFTDKRKVSDLPRLTVSQYWAWFRTHLASQWPNTALQSFYFKEFIAPFRAAGFISVDGDEIEFETHFTTMVSKDDLLKEYRVISILDMLEKVDYPKIDIKKPLLDAQVEFSRYFTERMHNVAQCDHIGIEDDMEIVITAMGRLLRHDDRERMMIQGRTLGMLNEFLTIENLHREAMEGNYSRSYNDVTISHACVNVMNFLHDSRSRYKLKSLREVIANYTVDRFFTTENRRLFAVLVATNFENVKFHTGLVMKLRSLSSAMTMNEFMEAHDPLSFVSEVPNKFHPKALFDITRHYLSQAAYEAKTDEVYFICSISEWDRGIEGQIEPSLFSAWIMSLMALYYSKEIERVYSDPKAKSKRIIYEYTFELDTEIIRSQVRDIIDHSVTGSKVVTRNPEYVLRYADLSMYNTTSKEIHTQTAIPYVGFGKFIDDNYVISNMGYDSKITAAGRFWKNGKASTVNIDIDFAAIINHAFTITGKRVAKNVFYSRAMNEHIKNLEEVLKLAQNKEPIAHDYVAHTLLDQVRDILINIMSLPQMNELVEKALRSIDYPFTPQAYRENFYNDTSMRLSLTHAIIAIVCHCDVSLLNAFFHRIQSYLNEAYYSKFRVKEDEYYR